MVDVTALATLVVAGSASLFMAWTIGAGSSGSTPFAPAVGANAISVMRAGFVVGLLGFAGAVLQGANVSEAVGRDLIGGVTLSPVAATTGLFIAAVLVAIGVYTGYPIATAFTVTGAIVGTGVALGGDPAWGKYQQILSLWLVTPFLGGGAAYLTAKLLRAESVAATVSIPALGAITGAIVANIGFVSLGPTGESASIATAAAAAYPGYAVGIRALVTVAVAAAWALALRRDVAGDERAGQRHFLLVLGALVAFSAGGSQVGLAIGPLVPLLEPLAIPLLAVLIGGGLGLLVGSWMGATRMIKAIAQDYSSLSPRRSIAALIPSFVIAQVAIGYGIPVSFNEIIVSAVIGSGYAAGGSSVSRRKMLYTVGAWAGSLVVAIAASYGVLTVITPFLR